MKTATGRTLGLIGLSIGLFVPSAANAQPLHHTVETLEWMAVDSPVIIRGTVSDFARTTDPSGEVWDAVVVRVRETLKGRPKPFYTFVIENRVYRDDLPRWRRIEQEILVFLVPSGRQEVAATEEQRERLAPYDLAPRYSSYGRQAFLELAAPKEHRDGVGAAYTLDLQELTDPQAILQRTRAAIVAAPREKCPRAHRVFWPKAAAVNIERVVPIDHRLEQQARLWIESDEWGLREEGARALGHFPAAANVARLKELLADPFYTVHVKREEGKRIETGREYVVRRAAYESLKRLGVQVPKPVLYVLLPDQEGAPGDSVHPEDISQGPQIDEQATERQSCSAEDGGGRQPQETRELSMTIRPIGGTVFTTGQTIVLEAIIRSTSQRAVYLGKSISDERSFEFDVEYVGGGMGPGEMMPLTKEGRRRRFTLLTSSKNIRIELEPGERRTYHFEVNRLYDMTLSGTYAIRARRAMPGPSQPDQPGTPATGVPEQRESVELTSNRILVEIKSTPPAGGADGALD